MSAASTFAPSLTKTAAQVVPIPSATPAPVMTATVPSSSPPDPGAVMYQVTRSGLNQLIDLKSSRA
jgi:hypothetical protein